MFRINPLYLDYVFLLIIISWIITLYMSYSKTLAIKQVRLIFFIRLLFFSLLTYLLIEPRLIINKTKSIEKDWNLYMDNSLSMSYHNMTSSLSLAKGVNQLVKKFKSKDIKIIPFTFGSNLDTSLIINEGEINSSSTDIGQVLDHIESNQDEISGAIIVTDGQVNSGDDILGKDFSINIPIHSIGIGNKTPLVDVSIQSVEVPPAILKGESIDLKVTVTSIGEIKERLNVMVYSREKILGSKMISVQGNGSLNHIIFRIIPEITGEINYLIKVNSAPEEINILNNKQEIKIQVLKSEYSIALFTGSPNFNTSIIKNILKENNEFKVDHFIFKNGKYSKPLKYFWDTKYDLILFDNHPIKENYDEWSSYIKIFTKKIISNQTSIGFFNGFDTHQETLQKYLSLIDIKLNKPLIELDSEFDWSLNKRWNSFFPFKKFRIKDLDLKNLPPLFVNMEIDSLNLISLANFNLPEVKIPLLMVGEKKNIRFIIWSSPELYKLYFRTQVTNLSSITKQLFNPLFSWLMKTGSGEDFYFLSDKNSYQQGEKIIIRGKSIYDNNKNLDGIINVYDENELINSKPIIFNKDLEAYEGYFYASKPGRLDYEIEFLNDNNKIIVSRNSVEIQESQVELNKVYLNQSILDRLTKETGGDYFSWNDKDNLFGIIEKDVHIKNFEKFKKFTELRWYLVILLILISFEWLIRKRRGFS